jgi:hypothetical protein
VQRRYGADTPLPDVFSGCCFKIGDGINDDEKKELVRHIVAFNGYAQNLVRQRAPGHGSDNDMTELLTAHTGGWRTNIQAAAT